MLLMILFKMKKILLTLTIFITSLLSEPLSDNKIQARLNILHGNTSECLMHKFYTNTGWVNIEGEVGRNGIDGLYYKSKNNIIREVLVSESKWNKSRLGRSGKNKLLKQMSQQWIIKTLNRLQKYKPLPQYKAIKKLIEHNQYRARLFKVFPRDEDKIQIVIYRLKNKGVNEYDKIIESKLNPIIITAPKNSFEIGMVDAYNQCKKEAIDKYFHTISAENITILLKDNYLKKQDIKPYL